MLDHQSSPFIQHLRGVYIAGRGAIQEVEVIVFYPALDELLLVVLGFVQPDDSPDIECLENGDVVFGSEYPEPIHVSWGVVRSAEGNELVRNNPVQVPILDFFIILVLSEIECFDIEPPQLHRILQAFEAVQYRAFVGTGSEGGVPEICKRGINGRKRPPRFLSGFSKGNHLKSPHQISGIGSFGGVSRTKVINHRLLIGWDFQELVKLSHKAKSLGQVQRSEIGIKWFIFEFLSKK